MAFISNATSFKQLLPFLIVGGICIAAIVMSSYGQTAIEALTMRMEVLDYIRIKEGVEIVEIDKKPSC